MAKNYFLKMHTLSILNTVTGIISRIGEEKTLKRLLQVKDSVDYQSFAMGRIVEDAVAASFNVDPSELKNIKYNSNCGNAKKALVFLCKKYVFNVNIKEICVLYGVQLADSSRYIREVNSLQRPFYQDFYDKVEVAEQEIEKHFNKHQLNIPNYILNKQKNK